MSKSQTSPQIPPKDQEDELSDECKKLLSTLPKERGWSVSHIYNYQGFWAKPRVIQGVIACQQQFQAQDSDIILVTNPKSGTTWLKSLLFTLVNRVKHPIFEQNHLMILFHSWNSHSMLIDKSLISHPSPHLDSCQLICSLLHSQNLSKIQIPNLFIYVEIPETLLFLRGIL